MNVYPITNQQHFCGYRETLSKVVAESCPDIDRVRKGFTELFDEVRIDKTIEKTDDFNIVQKLFQEFGLKEMLETLGSPFTSGPVHKLFQKVKNNEIIVLAKKGEKPVVSLVDEGNYGFFNCLLDLKNKQRKITINFEDDSLMKGYSLGKRSNYETHSTSCDTYTFTSYHPSGYKQKEVQNGVGFQNKVYFNPDGSMNTGKTAIFGGPAVPTY